VTQPLSLSLCGVQVQAPSIAPLTQVRRSSQARQGAIVQLSKDGTKLWKLIATPVGKWNDWYSSFNGSAAPLVAEQLADHERRETHDALVAHYESSQPCGATPCLYELFSDPTERHDLHSMVRCLPRCHPPRSCMTIANDCTHAWL
jgi:hypothetical protein